jgi:hypothetical protein
MHSAAIWELVEYALSGGPPGNLSRATTQYTRMAAIGQSSLMVDGVLAHERR